VIATENSETILITHFQSDKQGDGLHWVVATVNVISHEEVVGVWGLAANFEQFTQVVELSVNVATNGHWCFHLRHIWLVDKDFFSL